jgi:hypothetical protein
VQESTVSKIVLDSDLRSRLNGLNEHLEVCDEQGHTVGHFLPAEMYQQLMYASVQIPYSEDEIKRRRAETGGRSLAEFWKSLGQS